MTLDHMATYRTLSSLSRVQLLYILQQDGGQRTVDELAAEVGLHHNTVREHLQKLVDNGFVLAHSEHREQRGRPRLLYTIRSGAESPIDGVASRRLETARQRADLLKRVFVGQRASDPLPDSVDEQIALQLDVLEDHLDQSGFDPQIDESSLTVDLHACPFLGMVAEHQNTVCSVHFGLVHMMLALSNGPLDTDRLSPFLVPGMCRLRLRLAEAAAPEGAVTDCDPARHTPRVVRVENGDLIISGR